MEVEAAGDAVDVKDFACEVEAGAEFAFHGFEIDFFEIDAAAGDEFFFVGRFALDGVGVCVESLGEQIDFFKGEVVKAL